MGIIGGESQKKRRGLTVPTGQHFIFEMKTWSFLTGLPASRI
jgi:hypothetical protein